MDVNRYQQDLAALSPSHQLSLLSLSGIDRRFGNGFLQTWTLGVERAFGGSPAKLVMQALSSSRRTSAEELIAIRELLDRMEGDKK